MLNVEVDLNNAVRIKNIFIEQLLHDGAFVVDATVGNGHDLLFLSNKVGENGRVLGFDIQKAAIDKSLFLLKTEAKYNNYNLICDCHTRMNKYIDRDVDMFVYNLGYLPGGDKTKTTNAENTIASIKIALPLLKKYGSIITVCYPGHESGYKEENAIRMFTEKLNQKEWSVLRMDFTNQINNPPVLYFIQKR